MAMARKDPDENLSEVDYAEEEDHAGKKMNFLSNQFFFHRSNDFYPPQGINAAIWLWLHC